MTQATYHLIRNATARLVYGGKTFLLDPMLSGKGELPSFADIAPNPTVDLPIPAQQIIADIDVVIVSHLHDDHFDNTAAELLDKTLPLVTPRKSGPAGSFKERLEAKGFADVHEIGSPEANHITLDGITIDQVFARHGKGTVGDAMGDVFGLVFQADGEPTIYWAGDTILDAGVLVTAVSTKSFAAGVGMLARGGTMALVGLPPGGFELPIFDVVLSAKTICGSIVGTRNDLAEALAFAGEGKVKTHYATDKIENINTIFDRMKDGMIDGRIVLDMTL